MHRLYRQIYLTIIASLLLVVLFGGAFWRFAPLPPLELWPRGRWAPIGAIL